MRSFILLLCLMLILISCNKKEEKNNTHSGKKIETKNIPIIRNKIKPSENSLKINFRKIKEISLEDLRKNSNISITSITDIAASNGDIFLADPRICKIVKIDSTGKFITSFCSRGGGPGELGSMDGFIIINDTIFISDAVRSQKIVKYDLNGKFLKDFHIPQRPPKFLKKINYARVLGVRAQMAPTGFAMLLSIYDTKNFSEVKNLNKIDVAFKNGKLSLDPTDYISFYAASESNIYVSQISDYEYKFNKYSLDGKLEAIISNTYRKVEMTKEEQERIQKTVQMNNEKNKINTNYRKAINGIWVDKKNRVWVLASKANLDGTSKKEIYFDIFDVDGHFLNTVLFDLIDSGNDFTLMKKIFFSENYIYLYDNDEILIYDYN